MIDQIAHCYRTLELEPDASLEAVKQAYRELIKVWHPDRFPNDLKFQKRANTKTKEINEAYRKILAFQSGNYSESRPRRFEEEARARPRAEAEAASRAKEREKAKAGQEPQKPLARAFGGLVGLFIGVSLLKFGNPVIFEHSLDPPHGYLEIIYQSWPIGWGYWILGFVVISGLTIARWKVMKPTWMLVLPLLWLGWQFVSATQTVDLALTRATLKHFIACAGCFYLGYFALSEIRDLSLFWGAVLACFGAVLWTGLDQHFGGLERTRQFVYEQSGPQQLSPDFLKKLGSNRIFSTLVYPNAFAGVIILVFPGAAMWAWKSSLKLPNVVRGVLVGLLAYGSLACLFWSGSKAGWLIVLVIGVVALLHLDFHNRFKLWLLAVFLIAGLSCFAIKYSTYFKGGATSVGARFDYWRAGLQIAKENPWLGTGPGTFSIPYKRIKQPNSEMARLSHNDYLEQLCDSGIPGFLLFSGWITGFLIILYRESRAVLDVQDFSILLGVTGWAMQELVEFGLYIPALAWTAFVFLGWLGGRQVNEFDSRTTIS